jgi:beta-glucosidase
VKRLAPVLGLLLLAACTGAEAAAPSTTAPTTTTVVETPAYLDPSASVEVRVDDLLGRMTLDEKIGQMTLAGEAFATPSLVTTYALGGVLSGGGGAPADNTPAGWIEMIGGFQDAALSTRLGIPILYGSDAVHGHSNLIGATIFPHNVGLGAARSAELVERIGRATAIETAATGVNWSYAPVLAVAQDIRWGRAYEAFGEDTALVTELGAALLRGLQGDDLASSDTVLATPKHFVGDGAAEWGTSTTGTFWIDQGDTGISEAELREVHLPPYLDAIDEGALSVMASYSSFQGTKLHASRYLLTDVLKGELGFAGFVVSDWAAIDQIHPDDYAASVVAAINAGIDMNMVPGAFISFIDILRSAVESGDVPIERIDDAVRRILRAKFALGLFEQPHPDTSLVDQIRSDEHRSLAAEAVALSQVLLAHDGEALPIEGESILVAGQAAADVGWQSGGWTISHQGAVGPTTPGTTILDGILERVSPGTTVVHDPKGRFTDGPDRADVGIVVIGERPYAEGRGDNGRLTVDDSQTALVDAVRERVDRLVLVVVSGRPLMIADMVGKADAVVAAWLPGSEGAAVADPLFGVVPFSGTLPVTWPRTIGQLPLGSLAGSTDPCDAPLFPFGHGLSVDDTFIAPVLDCEAES